MAGSINDLLAGIMKQQVASGSGLQFQSDKNTTNRYDEYTGSGHYDATGVAGLQQQLAEYNKTDDQLRQEATNAYQPTYDMERLAQQQKTQTAIQGYNNQLASMQVDYNKQLNQVASMYAKNLSTMLNNLTKRGLGRSSLVGTGSVAVANAQQQAQQQVIDEYQTEANNVYNNISLATQQGADTLAQLDSSYAQQIEARINDLKNTQQSAATQLQLQISQLQYQGYVDWLNTPKKQGGGRIASGGIGGSKGKTGSGGGNSGSGTDSGTGGGSSDDYLSGGGNVISPPGRDTYNPHTGKTQSNGISGYTK